MRSSNPGSENRLTPDGDVVTTWTLAARFASIGEAAAARSALDAAGIETYLADENLVSIDWLYSQAVGSLKLMVHDADVERAREVINSSAAAENDGDSVATATGSGGERVLHCSECGSPDLRRVQRFRTFLLIAVAFVGVGVAVGQTDLALVALLPVAIGAAMMGTHRCANCGHRSSPLVGAAAAEAQLPDRRDMVEEPCPRCGSLEVHRIHYRRLKAIPMLFSFAMLVVLPVWWALPKRRCDACGLALR